MNLSMRSHAWILALAERLDLEYDDLVKAATWFLKTGDAYGGKSWDHLMNESLPDEFWDHYEQVTGTVVPPEKRKDFFGCCI